MCTSKTLWKDGVEGSGNMHPGGACITCHAQKGGPAFKVAGTVYPTAHEPNDCNGVATSVNIVLTDAKGKQITIPANGVGNFLRQWRAWPNHGAVTRVDVSIGA